MSHYRTLYDLLQAHPELKGLREEMSRAAFARPYNAEHHAAIKHAWDKALIARGLGFGRHSVLGYGATPLRAQVEDADKGPDHAAVMARVREQSRGE